jgi:hypothetical protein
VSGAFLPKFALLGVYLKEVTTLFLIVDDETNTEASMDLHPFPIFQCKEPLTLCSFTVVLRFGELNSTSFLRLLLFSLFLFHLFCYRFSYVYIFFIFRRNSLVALFATFAFNNCISLLSFPAYIFSRNFPFFRPPRIYKKAESLEDIL